MSGPSEQQPLPWLHLITGEPPAGCDRAGAVQVRGRACRDRAGLLAEWADRLRFPEYFGHNWDALADCLADRVDQGSLTVVVDDAVHLLADEPPAQLRTLLTVLRDAAAAHPGSLRVLLRCTPADEPTLRRRMTAAAAEE
jgi:RNAse (barnase) inhibitor barstar